MSNTIRADALRTLIRRCCPSTDPFRPHIASLHFDHHGRVISTDGHRTHVLRSPLDLTTVTVPTWAINAALGAVGEINVGVSSGQVTLDFAGGRIVADQPEFPPWEAVRPGAREGAPRLVVEVPLTRALRELKRLRKAGDALVLSGLLYAPADGNSRNVVRFHARKMPSPHRPLENPPAPWDLEPAPEWNGQVGLQADYLLEALAAAKYTLGTDARLKGASVTLRAWGKLDPVLISWTDGEAIIMPVRL